MISASALVAFARRSREGRRASSRVFLRRRRRPAVCIVEAFAERGAARLGAVALRASPRCEASRPDREAWWSRRASFDIGRRPRRSARIFLICAATASPATARRGKCLTRPATRRIRAASQNDARATAITFASSSRPMMLFSLLTFAPSRATSWARWRAILAPRSTGSAIDHWNTEHPHIHVLCAGEQTTDGDLVISRDYISRGLRARAEQLVTLELGSRSEQEIRQSLERQVEADRWTPLDQALAREAAKRDRLDRPSARC